MDRKIVLTLFLIGIIFLSGCINQTTQNESKVINETSQITQEASKVQKTLDLSKELTNKIESAINEEFVIYININNVVYSDEILKIVYVSSEAGSDASQYGQMIEVMKQTIEYLEEKNIKPQKIELIATHFLTGNNYDIILTYDEVKSFTQANLGFDYWKNKVVITSE